MQFVQNSDTHANEKIKQIFVNNSRLFFYFLTGISILHTLTVQSTGNWVREAELMPLLTVAQTCTKSNKTKNKNIFLKIFSS